MRLSIVLQGCQCGHPTSIHQVSGCRIEHDHAERKLPNPLSWCDHQGLGIQTTRHEPFQVAQYPIALQLLCFISCPCPTIPCHGTHVGHGWNLSKRGGGRGRQFHTNIDNPLIGSIQRWYNFSITRSHDLGSRSPLQRCATGTVRIPCQDEPGGS